MKFEVSKKYFIILASLLVILTGTILVYTYGGTDPSIMGHTSGEVENLPWSKITDIPSDFADGVDNDTIAHVSGGLYGYCCSGNSNYCRDYNAGPLREPAYYSSGKCYCRAGYTLVRVGYFAGEGSFTSPSYYHSCLKN